MLEANRWLEKVNHALWMYDHEGWDVRKVAEDLAPTPPADDVREALALAIDPNALELNLYPWPLDAADRVLSIFWVRPRGKVSPPAEDVREAMTLIARDVHLYDGGENAAITGLHAQRIADAVRARFEVRPRGTVTDAEVAWAEHSTGFAWRDEDQRYGEYRAFLAGYKAARNA